MNDRDPTDLQGLARDQEDEANAERLERERNAADLVAVMKTKSGRRFMWRLLRQSRIFELSFAGHDATTNFNEGHRAVGNRFFAELHQHCPKLYAQMAAENA